MIAPWMVATVAPPRHLPSTRVQRCTGATSISRRKPNSRSQTMEIAEKIEVKSTVMPSTPGNMKVRKSKWSALEMTVDSPVPRMNKNSTGWASEVRIRIRLRRKRISSRFQTTHKARRSSLVRPPATRTTGTSKLTATLPPPPGPEPGIGTHALRARGLGIPNGAAGIGHEDVVESGPGHSH